MPDWLKEEPAEVEPAAGEEMPVWLMEEVEEESVPSAEAMPAWLTEMVETPAEETFEWAAQESIVPEVVEVAPSPEPLPEPVPARLKPEVEPEAPRVVAPAVPVTGNPLIAQYQQRLEVDPNDHVNRLAMARALRAERVMASSLDQYEYLIEMSQLLGDVSADLDQLAQENPSDPRMRRLLGDTYMRQGMLQQALDAYRSALEQL
jgi:tetratricopeptide (TPR) repeat protein